MTKRMNYGPRFSTSGVTRRVRLRRLQAGDGRPLKAWNELTDAGKRSRLKAQQRAVQNEMKELTIKKISLAHVRGLDDD